MARKPKRRKQLDLDKVLAGKAEATIDQLLDLIHRVNPTGSDAAREHMAARYEQKRTLQNQLILRFRDQLQVVADPDREGLITIHYRGRNACHTFLTELDADARAWAQRYLDEHRFDAEDTMPAPSPAKPAPARDVPRTPDAQASAESSELEGKTVSELLAQGQQALAEYDFETAQGLFQMATHRSGENPAAAVAYLEFLVDTFGDAERALTLADGLPKAVLSNPDVRGLLGIAAARTGQGELAQSYLKRLTSPRAAEAYCILCAEAIAAEDERLAESCLEQARQRDPENHEQLRTLAEKLVSLRRRARRPWEEKLKQLFDSGDMDSARTKTHACLKQWPDSPVAKSILQRIDEREKQDQIQDRMRRARQALEREEFPAALEHFQAALTFGCAPAVLGDGYLAAKSAVRRQEAEDRLQQLRELLRRPDPSGGLLAYLQTEASLRERLRNEQGLLPLEWLEALGVPSAGAKARMAVDAVMALQRATLAVESGGVEEAAALLSPHKRVLDDLPEAQRTWERIESLQMNARRTAAKRCLLDAQRAAGEHRIEDAFALLEKLERRVLSPEETAEAASLLQKVRREEKERQLERRFESLNDDGELLGARAVLDEWIALTAGEERSRLLRKRRDLTARIDREWRLPLDLDPDLSDVFLRLDFSDPHEDINIWLVPDTGAVVVAYPISKRLFIAVVDAGEEGGIRYAVLAPPVPMAGPLKTLVRGDTVWLFDVTGNMLEVGINGWELLRWEPLGRFVGSDEAIEGILYLPGDRFCWLQTSVGFFEFRVRIIDLERRRVHRDFREQRVSLTGVTGPRGCYLVGDEAVSALSVYADSGKHIRDYPQFGGHLVSAAASHPDGKSIVILSYEPGDIGSGSELIVSLVEENGKVRHQYNIPDSDGERVCSLVVRRDPDVLFVLYYTSDSEHWLSALSDTRKGLDRIYRVRVPADALLIRDENGGWVKLLTMSIHDGVCMTSLGENPPVLPGGPIRARVQVPRFDPPFFCFAPYEPKPSDVPTPEHLRSLSDRAMLDWAREYAELRNEPASVAGLIKTLLDEGRDQVLNGLLETALQDRDATIPIIYATMKLQSEAWDDVCRALTPILSCLDSYESAGGHICHVLGIALYRCGLLEDALDVWKRGLPFEFQGLCGLEAHIDLANYFQTKGTRDGAGADRPALHYLMDYVLGADRCLETADYGKAARVLDRPVVWMTREMQSLARRAFAFLRQDTLNPRDRFAKLVAVSSFLDERTQDSVTGQRDLRFPGAWDSERLDQVAQLAEVWLSQQLARRASDSKSP